MEERFWILPVDEGGPFAQLAGWWGVVDEEAGGVIAYAATEHTASLIRFTFALNNTRS